jgi:hypothetical protein
MWGFERMAVGEPFTSAMLRAANEYTSLDATDPPTTYLEIFGDPTLRQFVVSPPSNVQNTGSSGTVTLSWTASADADVSYHVYRSTAGIDGEFVRLTTAPVQGTTCTLYNEPVGSKLYQVRGIRFLTTGSGSFTNSSQGAFRAVQ